MKIIELLNKIVNEEEIPTIEYKGMRTICYYLYDRCGEQCDDRELKNILNYEVEIIEEKKIPEKLGYFDLTKYENEKDENGDDLELHYTGVADTFDDVYKKINEIIDYLKSKEKGE